MSWAGGRRFRRFAGPKPQVDLNLARRCAGGGGGGRDGVSVTGVTAAARIAEGVIGAGAAFSAIPSLSFSDAHVIHICSIYFRQRQDISYIFHSFISVKAIYIYT